MDNHTATEQAYKNGYLKGYDKGLEDAMASIVRCKDCIHNFVRYGEDECYCGHPDGLNDILKPNDFCSYGERREGE